jgi:hypothetical protein
MVIPFVKQNRELLSYTHSDRSLSEAKETKTEHMLQSPLISLHMYILFETHSSSLHLIPLSSSSLEVEFPTTYQWLFIPHILPQRLLEFPCNLSFHKVLQLPAILEFCEEAVNVKGDMSGGFG